jgi:hypothetical protein
MDHVDTKGDEYWDVLSDNLDDISWTPKDLGIGLLSEDWYRLAQIRDDPDRAIPAACHWLASLLQELSIQQPR